MAMLESFLLFSCLFPLGAQPHYKMVPTFKARLPPSFILSGNLYINVFLSPIKVTFMLVCELSWGDSNKHPCTRDRVRMTDQRKGFSKCRLGDPMRFWGSYTECGWGASCKNMGHPQSAVFFPVTDDNLKEAS